MTQDHIKKEALFNEVKGSLFEYLVAMKLARKSGIELNFIDSIDRNYRTVLTQQDRMVRQFYPEMLLFLDQVSDLTASNLSEYLKDPIKDIKLLGKFSNSSMSGQIHEADLLLELATRSVPVSLKLNKQNAFVNTKSGGIKSFFEQYFPIAGDEQTSFNSLVDAEFQRMAHELHALSDMEYNGSFSMWVEAGKSELPGELEPLEREVLKRFYARIAQRMHDILHSAQESSPEEFKISLPALMGFSAKDILQVICFHDFKTNKAPVIEIHTMEELTPGLESIRMKPFGQTSSVEFEVGPWDLQIRVKPMNKFTTTAIKINCSVRFRSRTSDS